MLSASSELLNLVYSTDEDGAEQLDSLLDTGNYNMNVTAGDVGTDYHDADDQGTLSLQDRSTEGLTVWTAPDGKFDDESSAADFWNSVGSTLSEADTITDRDDAVLAIEGSGLEAAFDAPSINFDGAPADEDDAALTLNVTHENPGMNANAQDLALTEDNTEIITDAENDTYFIILDTSEIGVDAESIVAVLAEDNQTISGETNTAPGNEIQVHLSSDDAESPFLITPETTVNEDGTFEASTDEFSDVGVGANFTATIRSDCELGAPTAAS